MGRRPHHRLLHPQPIIGPPQLLLPALVVATAVASAAAGHGSWRRRGPRRRGGRQAVQGEKEGGPAREDLRGVRPALHLAGQMGKGEQRWRRTDRTAGALDINRSIREVGM